MISFKLVKDEERGISIWQAIAYLTVFYIIIGISVGVAFGIVRDIFNLNQYTAISPYYDFFNEVIVDAVIILCLLKMVGRKGDAHISYWGNMKLRLFFSAFLFIIGYYIFAENTIHLALQNVKMTEFVQEAFEEMAKTPIVLFVSVLLLAPIFEELVMRGIILEAFLKRYNEGYAIFFSAFLFGIIHLNIPQFVNAFFLGLILGFIYSKTRSLLLCILAHATNNTMPFLFEIFDVNLSRFALLYCAAGILLMIFSIMNFTKIKRSCA